MDVSKLCVRERMSFLPCFVNSNDTLDIAVKRMEKFEVSKIVVCDEEFNVKGSVSKGEIAEYLLKKRVRKKIDEAMLKKIKVKEILRENSKFVMAYPKCSLVEVIEIMTTIKAKYLPVVQSPWNRKLEGFVKLDENLIKV